MVNVFPQLTKTHKTETIPSFIYSMDEEARRRSTISIACDDERKALTFEEFRIRAEEVVLGLLSLGMSRGDRVTLLMLKDGTGQMIDDK